MFVTLVFAGAPARSAVVVHEYALRGSLSDNQGGSPLASMGGQITALGYVFAANQGLVLTNPAIPPANFSIELSFRFDTVTGYRKIADFHDRADDSGLYTLNGNLNFYPVATAGTADFLPGVDVHVVLARDGGSGVVTGYVNGQLRFTFTDSSLQATLTAPDRKLILFADDFNTSQGEASAGTINYVRIIDGSLTAGEVNALFAAGAPVAVPEPSTHALLALGGVLLLGAWSRRRRRRPPSADIDPLRSLS